MTPSQSPWGDSETKFFFELTPTVILESVETSLGVRSTGRVMALNSLENRVYDVELDDEQNSHVVAKFYRPNRWTKEQILEEHQFLADLDHAEINVVRPLVFQDGSTLVTLAESGLRLAVFPKVRGRSPDELTTDHLRELGRLLARVHVVGSSRKASHRLPITPETYGSSSLTYLMGSPLLPPFIARDFEQTVKDLLAVINPLFQAIKPTEVIRLHGDCHLGNLIQTQRGLTLVDFDDMVVGPPVQDLWLLLPGSHPRDIDQVLNGYETMRHFDDQSLRLIEPLRALRMIHFAAWIAKRWSDPAFPRAFPHFNTPESWQSLQRDLLKALQAIT